MVNAPPISLATEWSEPKTDFEDFVTWIYGRPKIGKTSMLAQFKKCHMFLTEKGTEALKTRERLIKDWNEAVAYAKLWQDKPGPFKLGTVDVVETLYRHCMQWCAKKYSFTAPEWGQWGLVADEFMRVMTMFMNSTSGIVFVSHVAHSERSDSMGGKKKDVHPAGIKGQVLEQFLGKMDVVGYYHFRKKERVLQIRTDIDTVQVGVRLTNNFLFADTGEPIYYIPLGRSASEAKNNLMKAFNNELKFKEAAKFHKK